MSSDGTDVDAELSEAEQARREPALDFHGGRWASAVPLAVFVIWAVFHGWFLVTVFVVAAWTGFGREYTTDRETGEVARV